jgi:quinol monooxygenase YgiN
MFLFQETYYVRPGLQDVIDKRVRSLHENHATNPAYAAMDWMKYLGDGTTYLAFRLWHERNFSFDEAQGAFMSEYNKTRPADAFLAPPDIEYFEQVEQKGMSAQGFFLVRSEFHVAGGQQAAWGAWEQELQKRLTMDLMFREYRLYRYMGGENRYTRTEFWRSQESAIAFWREPEMREFTMRLGSILRKPQSTSYYEVLHQLGSAKPIPTLII